MTPSTTTEGATMHGTTEPAPTLAERAPGHAVMAETLRLQAGGRRRSRLDHFLGRSPLRSEARSWFTGALGERHVGRLLQCLGPRWYVLHAVPVGTRGSDIDHVVVGPAGVITVNTKHHPDKRVWVGTRTVLVSGQRQPYLRNSEHEAQRAAKLLGEALGRPVPVRGAVAVVGAASLTVKQAPATVAVLDASRLVRWLERLPVTLPDAEVAEVAALAALPGTWQRRPDPAGADPAPAFERLRVEVRSARRQRVVVALSAWAMVAGAGIIALIGVLR